MATEIDWSELHFRVRRIPVIAPCMSLSLHLAKLDEDCILDFYERALSSLGDRLTHSSIGFGLRRITPTALAAVPSWTGKMSEIWKRRQIALNPVGDGVGGAALSLSISMPPYWSEDPREAAKGWTLLDDCYRKPGDPNVLPSASLHISFPVDHALAASPDHMLTWVKTLRIVADGRFSSGTCGYGINYDAMSGGVQSEMMPRIGALCRQNPMLEFSVSPGPMRLFRYDGQTGRILHKVRRAGWLTLVSGEGIEQSGGAAALVERLGQGPASLHPLGRGAMLIQAGPSPLLRARSDEEARPYRQAAAAIRPIRIETLEHGPCGSDEPWLQEWLEAFEPRQ